MSWATGLSRSASTCEMYDGGGVCVCAARVWMMSYSGRTVSFYCIHAKRWRPGRPMNRGLNVPPAHGRLAGWDSASLRGVASSRSRDRDRAQGRGPCLPLLVAAVVGARSFRHQRRGRRRWWFACICWHVVAEVRPQLRLCFLRTLSPPSL